MTGRSDVPSCFYGLQSNRATIVPTSDLRLASGLLLAIKRARLDSAEAIWRGPHIDYWSADPAAAKTLCFSDADFSRAEMVLFFGTGAPGVNDADASLTLRGGALTLRLCATMHSELELAS
jgi:hypothetical protein